MAKKRINSWFDSYQTPDRRVIINPYIYGGTAPFTPASLPGLALWLKADSLGLSDGNPVGTWADQSGNGRDATAAGGLRPTYKTGILNGNPIVRFDGTNYMSGSISISQPTYGFIVVKYSISTATRFSFDGTTSRNAFFKQALTDGATRAVFAGNVVNEALANDGAFHVLRATFAGASSAMSLDGVETSGINLGAQGLGTSYYIGTDGGLAGATMLGDIAEIVCGAATLTAGQNQACEEYLGAKYGITITH